MDETLRQVGGLLLGSVPTIVFIILLYGLYTTLVHKPLLKVLAERHDKTQGAIEKARADIASAEARTAEYEQKLREARLSVFKAQEARRQIALQARTAALNEARSKAQAQVKEARAAIEADKVEARKALEVESSSLAQEIIRTVLRPSSGPATTTSAIGGQP
jgi:F-type H+-transporting ATPase subunit b